MDNRLRDYNASPQVYTIFSSEGILISWVFEITCTDTGSFPLLKPFIEAKFRDL
jgi:hypothetical protein